MPAFQFNSQGIEPQYGGGGGLPFGKHPVVITQVVTEADEGRAGRLYGTYASGDRRPGEGLVAFDRLNLHNKSPIPFESPTTAWRRTAHVTGVFAFNATEELHNKPFVVEIVQKPRSDNPQSDAKSRAVRYERQRARQGRRWRSPTGGQPQGGGAWGGKAADSRKPAQDRPRRIPGWRRSAGLGRADSPNGAAVNPRRTPAGGATWNQGQGGGQPGWGATLTTDRRGLRLPPFWRAASAFFDWRWRGPPKGRTCTI
jgi:hypothetical protein